MKCISQSNHTLALSTPTFFNLKIETLLHKEFIGYIEHINKNKCD